MQKIGRNSAVAMTGCTGGLGREVCRVLAQRGVTLYMLDRNEARSRQLAAELTAEYPEFHAETVPVDLERMETVRAACDRLAAVPLQAFFHDAGAYSIPRHRCDTGFDNVFQINFLSPYYLIRRLTETHPGLHVAAVGSIAYRYSATDPADVDFTHRTRASRVYGNAKRYLMFSLYEWAREHPQATLSVVHPGITLTNITAHYPKVVFALIRYPMKLIFMSPRRAARCLICGLDEPGTPGTWVGPRWLDIWGPPCRRELHDVSPDEQRRIGETAERLYRELRAAETTSRQ